MKRYHHQCPVCGGQLSEDDGTHPVSCEFADVPADAEADSGPYYCKEITDEDT